MQFELVRLSMLPRTDLFARAADDGTPFTREGWLRDIFSKEMDFQHRGELFHFSPDGSEPSGPLIVGRIGRKVTSAENEPPTGHLAPTKRDIWKAATVLLDPTHHADGQKAAVQHDVTIGRPVALLESLAAHINALHEPFIVETNAIVPSDTFWNFVKLNEGEITSVEFEFVAPNMFGEADDYDDEMRSMQANEKIQKAKLKLESKDGLSLNTTRVQRAADYANKGAGSIQARTKKGKKYSSKEKAQKITIPNKDVAKSGISSLISRIFGGISRT